MKASLARRVPFVLVVLAFGGAGPDLVISTPAARIQTDPVPTDGDAADDPAIWIHPVDPAKSLVFGTDKKGGLHSYSLDGRERQLVSPGCRPNNVDILYGFSLGAARQTLPSQASAKGARRRALKSGRSMRTDRSPNWRTARLSQRSTAATLMAFAPIEARVMAERTSL